MSYYVLRHLRQAFDISRREQLFADELVHHFLQIAVADHDRSGDVRQALDGHAHGYPEPMVDHATERDAALADFAMIKR